MFTSTGSNWYAGGNSVTVTSDLSSGNGGFITIRPANTACGTGLTNGQSQAVLIPVSRPAPTLSINGNDVICLGGNTSYTVLGLTTGATVCWSISNSSIASISSPSCANSITVSYVNKGLATLTATVSDCTGSYPAVPKPITLGSPTPSITAVVSQFAPTTADYTATLITGATYNWYVSGYTNPLKQTGTSNQFEWYFPCNITRTVYCTSSTSCGAASSNSNSITTTGSCVKSLVYSVSPNPATNDVNISAPQSKTTITASVTFDAIRVFDLHGNLKKYNKYSKSNQATINILGLKSGSYFIEITNGKYKERHQIIIQK